jgi:hypothetical protein
MKIGIVSTFSDKGYQEYGQFFIESCKKHINKDIEIFLYIDTVSIVPTENMKVLNLEPSCPDLVKFKERNKDKAGKSWMWDAVRFSHKTYATFHAAETYNVDYLIWLDSDTEIYNDISKEYLLTFLPKGTFVGYLGRDGTSETGFLIFDMHHPHAKDFFNRYKEFYNNDEVYTIPEWHDAYVFDHVRKELEAKNLITSFNISLPGVKKNHFNSTFDGYMIHYKGDEKSQRNEKIAKKLRQKGKHGS